MKKALLVICIIAAFLGLLWAGTYSSLVSKREDVKVAWGKVESAYERRASLIPNLVNTVKGYAKHEKGIFDEIARARQSIGTINTQGIEADVAKQKQLIEAQGQLSTALGKLIALSESNPELKADKVFINLQHELAGSENRINSERVQSQKFTGEYNKTRLGFFSRIVANTHGFEEIAYYTATTPNASVAPVVEF